MRLPRNGVSYFINTMSTFSRLERMVRRSNRSRVNEWNDSAYDLLNPTSLSTKIYSEEDPLSSSGQVIIGQEKGAGSADLVVPEDVVDVLKNQDDNNGVIGKGFVSFLKTTFKELEVDDVSYNREKTGGAYFDMVFPGNRVISVSVWGDDGDQKLAVIYKLADDEKEIEVKDLKDGAFKVDGDVNADVFPVDWLMDTVKEVLDEMSDDNEKDTDDNDDEDALGLLGDDSEDEEDSDEDTKGSDKFFRDDTERKKPSESKFRMVRYGGMNFISERGRHGR